MLGKISGTIINKGTFFSAKLNNNTYSVVKTKSSSKELIEFFLHDTLVSSVFVEYKIVGSAEVSSYGDFGIYTEYEGLINKYKFLKFSTEDKIKEELTNLGLHTVYEKLVEGRDYIKLGFFDKLLAEISIKTDSNIIIQEDMEFFKSTKVTKRKDYDYVSRTELYNKSTISKVSNLRSLAEISCNSYLLRI